MQHNVKGFQGAASKAVDKNLREGIWEVFDSYELRDGEALAAVGKEGRVYRPLTDTPALFLEFASLPEDPGLDDEPDTQHNAQTAREWAETYGTLGLTAAQSRHREGTSTRGGSSDTVAAFVSEARIANQTLRLWEAATARDGPDLDAIHTFARQHYRPHVVKFFTDTPERSREFALSEAAKAVQEKVGGSVYPSLYGHLDDLKQGWDFTNLLGAMWMQMFWVLIDPSRARRCERPGCERVVYHEQPESGEPPADPGFERNARLPYNTRKDKKFCSDKCRNSHYYHTVTKPRRRR